MFQPRNSFIPEFPKREDVPLRAKSPERRPMSIADIQALTSPPPPVSHLYLPEGKNVVELDSALLEEEEVTVDTASGMKISFFLNDFIGTDENVAGDGDILPDNLIFLYRAGNVPDMSSVTRADMLQRLAAIPIVFVLHIQKGLSVPANWIDVLTRLKHEHAGVFDFVCMRGSFSSSGLFYLRGEVCAFSGLVHNSSFITDGKVLERQICEQVEIYHAVENVRQSSSIIIRDRRGDPKAGEAEISKWMYNGRPISEPRHI